MLLAFLSALPIIAVFVLLVIRRWPAVKAMGVGWIIAALLGLAVWRMTPSWWGVAALYGALQASEIIITIFGAILLMSYLEHSGALSTIRWHFTTIHADRRVQLLLLGFGVVTIIEGVAGFGTPAALVAPLLIGLGFPPLAAAVFALWFNAPNPPFGVAGIPTRYGVGSVIGEVLPAGMEDAFMQSVIGFIGVFTGLAYVFWGLLAVCLLIFWFGKPGESRLRAAVHGAVEVAPLALVLGCTAGGVNALVAWFIGAELPAITAGFVTLGLGLILARRGTLMPRKRWDFPAVDSWSDLWRGGLGRERLASPEMRRGMPVYMGWLPYLLVVSFLFVTRLPGLDLAAELQEVTLGVSDLFGSGLAFELRPLYLPGLMPFIPVAVLTGFLHKMPKADVISSWRRAARQVYPAALTLIVSVSMAQIMIQSAVNASGYFGMIETLSRVVASGAGSLLPFVSPWIGILGGFMTGSNTSSNILFSALQYRAAEAVGVSRTIVVALQSTGGGIGNLVSVLNVAAIAGVTGITGREGDIIKKTLLPMAIYGVAAGLIGLLFTYVVVPGLF